MLYKRGKKGTYWFRFRFAGRWVHESARSMSKTVARDAERQRRRQLEESFNGIEKRKLPPTLGQASKTWIDRRTGLAEGTRETYQVALKHLKSKLGTILVCDIEPRHIAAYQRVRLAESAAAGTINKEIACLSSILSDCGVWAQIRRDVKRLPENEEAGRALKTAEETALLEHASIAGEHQGGWTPLYTVTVLALNTGMRHNEIRILKWKNVNLETRHLTVGASKTEAGRGRPIPLTQSAWAALTTWASRFPNKEPEHFIFPACENGRIDLSRPISNWRTAWRRATTLIRCPSCAQLQNPGKTCKNEQCQADLSKTKSSLDGLRFHDLRHTAATKLLEQGTPYPVVAQILGWSASTAVRMAKRYGHIRPEAQRRALEGVATAEIQRDVNQIVNQVSDAVESRLPN